MLKGAWRNIKSTKSAWALDVYGSQPGFVCSAVQGQRGVRPPPGVGPALNIGWQAQASRPTIQARLRRNERVENLNVRLFTLRGCTCRWPMGFAGRFARDDLAGPKWWSRRGAVGGDCTPHGVVVRRWPCTGISVLLSEAQVPGSQLENGGEP